MSIIAYNKAVETGALVKKPVLADDREFYGENPGHPLASENRFKRISAADEISDYAKEKKKPFPQKLLIRIHRSLFDCCAAVRHSAAAVIFYAGNVTSIPCLELPPVPGSFC